MSLDIRNEWSISIMLKKWLTDLWAWGGYHWLEVVGTSGLIARTRLSGRCAWVRTSCQWTKKIEF